jgi:hypothetical protein
VEKSTLSNNKTSANNPPTNVAISSSLSRDETMKAYETRIKSLGLNYIMLLELLLQEKYGNEAYDYKTQLDNERLVNNELKSQLSIQHSELLKKTEDCVKINTDLKDMNNLYSMLLETVQKDSSSFAKLFETHQKFVSEVYIHADHCSTILRPSRRSLKASKDIDLHFLRGLMRSVEDDVIQTSLNNKIITQTVSDSNEENLVDLF